jgi:hypothetical protein
MSKITISVPAHKKENKQAELLSGAVVSKRKRFFYMNHKMNNIQLANFAS